MANARVLLVDDDELALSVLCRRLEQCGFDMTTASNATEALHRITTQTFEVLLSDLHMPGPGDGLTVISAMRRANPQAVTLLLSAFPEMDDRARAILLQTGEIMIKPIDVAKLAETIKQRLAGGPVPARLGESVDTVLARWSASTVRRSRRQFL